MSDAGQPPTAWAAFLRDLTKRPGWSVARLARDSGVHRATIFRWLNGEVRNVTITQVRKIAATAGVDEAIALRAAGDIVKDDVMDDEESIRLIMDSDASDEVKEELVREIRRLQRQHADERVTWAHRLLEMTRRVRGAT